MSGANYEYCPVCDQKALYVGEDDVPDSIVVLHSACLEKAKAAERERVYNELAPAPDPDGLS